VASQRIMRMTVRGRFSELSAHASEYLRSNQDQDDPDELAGARALSEAELFLRTMGFGYRDLKTVVMDMADVWSRRAG
jgi:hypothetical protein